MAKEDPLEKIRTLIREEIGASEKNRERKEIEAKDPWEKLRGVIREEIAANKAPEVEEKSKVKPKDDGGEDKILGGIFG